MLDVHPPHKRMREVGEYFVHLVVITIGLLIATQIESCVEWRAHVRLADEARVALHKEIAANLKALRDAEPGLKQWQAQVKDNIADMQRVLDHPNDPAAQPHRFHTGCGGISLDNTAWQTAQSTGALDYMPYKEASAYVNIYTAQKAFLKSQNQPCADAAAISGILAQYPLDAKGARFSREEAAALANNFGRMQFHLELGAVLFDENIELNAAFLEGREPRKDFSGSLN